VTGILASHSGTLELKTQTWSLRILIQGVFRNQRPVG